MLCSNIQKINYHVSKLPGAPKCPNAPSLSSSLTLPKK